VLDLLSFLSKSAKIGRNVLFCERIRAQLFGAEGLVTRDSRALGTIFKCPYLFDFSTRQLAFKIAACDFRTVLATVSRELAITGNQPPDASDHLKVHVHRDAVFVDGTLIMRHFASTQCRLEVSFLGEEGIGHGPTHEFFTLFSRELCKTERGLFRSDSRTTVYAKAQCGLFFSPAAFQAGVELLGIFIAKALQMGCLVDMNLNPALFSFLRGNPVTVADIDPVIAHSLESPNGLIGMPFVYPGLDIPLLPGGEGIAATPETIAEWVALVTDFTCGTHLNSLREAFMRGFERVIPFWTLSLFDDREICAMLRGETVKFGVSELREHVVFSRFAPDSPEVAMLLEVIADFSVEEQRLLVQFITGYAQLPIGGLGALEPKLTIAKRFEENPDSLLPSVMTCKNYFKVPSYSSKKIIHERILTAITEGQGSFDLT
jgi:E3 ubiquitin-protein ligase TRIP12